MPDYIVKMKVDSLKPNPINSEIYDDNQSALEEIPKQNHDTSLYLLARLV